MPYTSVLAGALDGATGISGVRHDFVAFKGDYYRIEDGLPQYETFPRR